MKFGSSSMDFAQKNKRMPQEGGRPKENGKLIDMMNVGEDDGSVSNGLSTSSEDEQGGSTSPSESSSSSESGSSSSGGSNQNSSGKKKQKVAKQKSKEKQLEKVTKEYKTLVMKAQKSISYSRDIKQVCKDEIKYYIMKAISYYRRAFPHCRQAKDQARLYVMMAEAYIDLTPKLYEHDVKGKHLAKACECLKNALQLVGSTGELEVNIVEDLQMKMKEIVQKSFIDKIEDPELICTIFEMIFQNLHPRMKRMIQFVGNELYSVYYKIACEICDCRGDLDNASRYLSQCKFVAKKIGISDNEVISMKLDEVNKMKKRKVKEKNVGEARENMHLADLYLQQGKITEALSNYKMALKMSKDKNPEIEAICHFKLGKLLMQNGGSDLEKARNHIVDFQIQCQMIKDRGDSIQKKWAEALQLLQQIQGQLKQKRKPHWPRDGPCNKTTQQAPNNGQGGGIKKQPNVAFHPQAKQKMDPEKIKSELNEMSNRTVFDIFKYVKEKFHDKTSHLELLQDKYAEKSKVRKMILKFISIFHPDKQCQEDVEFFKIAEEITKQFNQQLKFY